MRSWPKVRTPVYSVFCEGTKIAWLGANEYLSAGIAFARLMIWFSTFVSAGMMAAPMGVACAEAMLQVATAIVRPKRMRFMVWTSQKLGNGASIDSYHFCFSAVTCPRRRVQTRAPIIGMGQN